MLTMHYLNPLNEISSLAHDIWSFKHYRELKLRKESLFTKYKARREKLDMRRKHIYWDHNREDRNKSLEKADKRIYRKLWDMLDVKLQKDMEKIYEWSRQEQMKEYELRIKLTQCNL